MTTFSNKVTGTISDVKLIAFYLPQFHTIPENDAWWGKGFTEWTNVTKAKPLFDGHYQPHLPTDLGFYDLRIQSVRREQIRMAKEYGIEGFCYHYYWFSGKRLLHQPLDDMLADPGSDIPFCLCWANENWTRRWDGAEREVLIAQRYLPEDALEFIKSVAPFLCDPRYIRSKGNPLLIVYCPQRLPEPQKTVAVWREHCRSIGLGEIHICAALTYGNEDYAQYGFDSGVEFPPHNNSTCVNVAASIPFHDAFSGNVIEFPDIARTYLQRRYENSNVFRTVTPSWDNTARTGNRAVIIIGGTPENYEFWLAEAIRHTRNDFPDEERFVFINAWNEWAEGCHLEPDRRFQRRFLEATKAAKLGESTKQGFAPPEESHEVAARRRTLLSDLISVLRYHGYFLVGRVAGSLKKFPTLRKAIRWMLNHLP
jgi:lipopolysaccharide biosynthesis protein